MAIAIDLDCPVYVQYCTGIGVYYIDAVIFAVVTLYLLTIPLRCAGPNARDGFCLHLWLPLTADLTHPSCVGSEIS